MPQNLVGKSDRLLVSRLNTSTHKHQVNHSSPTKKSTPQQPRQDWKEPLQHNSKGLCPPVPNRAVLPAVCPTSLPPCSQGTMLPLQPRTHMVGC